MTQRLHDELAALSERFHLEGLPDEEWALLQVHMAYCSSCRSAFEECETESHFQQEQMREPDSTESTEADLPS